MMLVIVLFIFGVFHRPVAGYRQAVGTEYRIKVRTGNILVKVLGKEFSADLDPYFATLIRDFDLGIPGRVESWRKTR
jgi:hypothetical protein